MDARSPTPTLAPPGFELCFCALFDAGRSLAFPCDAAGRVDLDALSERARTNYFSARRRIGRELGFPAVRPRPAA